jgi:hypothetical protein
LWIDDNVMLGAPVMGVMLRLKIILVCLLTGLFALADRRPGSGGERTVSARVLKVENATLHVAIGDRGDKGADVIVPTTEKTEIRLDGEPAKLTDLAPDMLASITQVDGITTLIDCKRPQRRR